MNKHIIIGRVDRLEQKTTQNGKTVTNFTVLHTETYIRDGQPQEFTDYLRCVLWEKPVDFGDGDMVYVEGAVKTRSYEDKSGQKQYMTETRVERAERIGGDGSQQPSSPVQPDAPMPGEDDSLPF